MLRARLHFSRPADDTEDSQKNMKTTISLSTPGELETESLVAVVLDHVIDGDHAGVVQPGRRTRLAHRAGDEVGVLLRRLRRQQDLLDRHYPVKQLILAAPYPAHATLTRELNEQVPPANQTPRPTRHIRMIGKTSEGRYAGS